MHFLGLPFATLAPFMAAVGAVVVGLYILKLRRRPVPVPFSPLWSKILRDKEATSLFSRLKRLLSLLLQLLLVGLLFLALMDPRTAVEVVKGRNLVVLVDTSASMQAADAGGEKGKARIELARDELRKLVRGLGASDRMLIASLDTVVTPLSPMTGDTARLETAVDDLKPVD
ncbi:MAG: VWA domain-containing protein, partial [Polyangiales bacterium]